LICQPRYSDHEIKGLLAAPMYLGLNCNPAGAALVLSSGDFGYGPAVCYFHHGGSVARPPDGPAEAVLELVAVSTSERPHIVRVCRQLGISGEFDQALRQAIRDMEKADWPVYTHVRWWIDCESRSTPVELAANCTARCQARDLKPKEWEDDGA
jgi:hypothetical protein